VSRVIVKTQCYLAFFITWRGPTLFCGFTLLLLLSSLLFLVKNDIRKNIKNIFLKKLNQFKLIHYLDYITKIKKKT